ncbi:MAG: hypothetical protein ACO1OF_16305 [Adhaeribacter sp.]
MRNADYYKRKTFKAIERVLLEVRAELAHDLKAGITDQATFDDADLLCLQAQIELRQKNTYQYTTYKAH